MYQTECLTSWNDFPSIALDNCFMLSSSPLTPASLRSLETSASAIDAVRKVSDLTWVFLSSENEQGVGSNMLHLSYQELIYNTLIDILNRVEN